MDGGKMYHIAALIDGVTANAYSLVSQAPSPMPKADEPLYNIIVSLTQRSIVFFL